MTKQYDNFLKTSLEEMNFPVGELTESTLLGDDLGVDSLTSSELGMRVSDAFGVTLVPEEVMSIPDLTVAQFVKLIASRFEGGSGA